MPADVDGAQAAKTLAHELAHVMLHDRTEQAVVCRGRAEVEAESSSGGALAFPPSSAGTTRSWCRPPGYKLQGAGI